MRTKSEEKRQAIVDVAAEIFREVGFERASMSEICARVGGSKATLYNHFPSKEELFFEVIYQSTAAEFEAAQRALDPEAEDIASALKHFGVRLLTLIYSPDIQAVRRLVIAESGRSDMGRTCYSQGAARMLALMIDFIAGAMREGKLRQADERIAALHLRGLLQAELIDIFQFQTGETIDAALINSSVEHGVEVFMRAYGPDPEGGA